LGRADDILISGGEKIHPNRVEPVLRRCPGVVAAALSARDDSVWGDRLVAVYVGGAEPQRLEAYCRERLSGAALPREYIRLQELPLGASGKLDRHELRRLLREISRQEPGRASGKAGSVDSFESR
jgi:O-succinylbenzoic acid--CoA ligase